MCYFSSSVGDGPLEQAVQLNFAQEANQALQEEALTELMANLLSQEVVDEHQQGDQSPGR